MTINKNQTALDPSLDTLSVTFAPGTKLREIEKIFILEILKKNNFNRTNTAIDLGVDFFTLNEKLKLYGVCDGTHM